MSAASSLVCAGCGAVAAEDDPYPFRCPNAASGDDVDHVMTRVLDPSGVRFPLGDDEPNPFVRYRQLFHPYHLARAHGMSDGDFVDLVRRLDKEVAGVDGSGFVETPFTRSEELSRALGFKPPGGVVVKDETGNVSGSHKARHMMGLLVHLEVVDRLGLATGGPAPDLAIASCGNAALAAAVVARAGQRKLQVFVPAWGDPAVISRLDDLQATVNVVPREEWVPGDPTYLALRGAIRGGALPFTCQGNENGLVIEGGHTLAYEMASVLAARGEGLDRVFVQVGGGALASAVVQGLREAVGLGALARLPKVHAVQTRGGFPLRRAYDRLAGRIAARLAVGELPEPERAEAIAARFGSAEVHEELAYAVRHRSEFMWPWEEEPKSIAHGILDDETYDWFAVVRGMLETAGHPIVVSEQELAEANELAHASTGIDVDHTGSSGLAGLLQATREEGVVAPSERCAVLFTGARR